MRISSLVLTLAIITNIFFFHTQSVYAESSKKPAGLLNLIILKKLLIAQQTMPQVQAAMITATKTAELSPIPTAGQSALTKLPTTPTATPKVLPIVSPTIVPTPTPGDTNPVTNVKTYLMNEINKYRAERGLSPVQTNGETCNFAKLRAEEIAKQFNHDGFNQRITTKSLPYAHWSKVSENLATTPNYTEVVVLWKKSPLHAANMREATPFVCVEQFGNYYAYEGMNP